jgi:hypothetical protein
MMLSRRSLWLWMGLFLIVLATAGTVTAAYRFYSGEALVEIVISVVTAGAGVAGKLWEWARRPERARLPLRRAADELAEQLGRQWEQAATERGLTHPAPISLEWRCSSGQVTGSRAEAATGPFAPLPGMEPVTAEDLNSGAVRDLHRLYAGLGSGRIIIPRARRRRQNRRRDTAPPGCAGPPEHGADHGPGASTRTRSAHSPRNRLHCGRHTRWTISAGSSVWAGGRTRGRARFRVGVLRRLGNDADQRPAAAPRPGSSTPADVPGRCPATPDPVHNRPGVSIQERAAPKAVAEG